MLRLLEGRDALPMAGDVWPCYDAVFGDRPDYEAWRDDLFGRHASRPGHRLVVATEGKQVVGFAWGHVGERGQFWSDLVGDALPAAIGEAWVGGHFEVVEMAVLESHRRQRLGQRLHDRLLDGVHRRCLLSTSDDEEDPAVRLYRRSGWTTLGALRDGVQVMGLDRA